MIGMFTFIIITYNHQEYVMTCLESIKYQISNFGRDKKIQLFVLDDCSSDKTVEKAKLWLDSNSSLFEKSEIRCNSINEGAVRITIKAFDILNESEGFIIAGDDVVYKNDLIHARKDYDFAITPTIPFWQDEMVRIERWNYFIHLLLMTREKHISKVISDELSYSHSIQSPGVMYSSGVVQDRELIEFMKQYTWIEDFPMWLYFFRFSIHDYSVKVLPKVFVLYRINRSRKPEEKHDNISKVVSDGDRLRNEYQKKIWMLPKRINPYYYVYALKRILVELCSKLNKKTRLFNDEYGFSYVEKEVNEYLLNLKKNIEKYSR